MRLFRSVHLALCLCLLSLGAAHAQLPLAAEGEAPTLAPVLERVQPAVVSIVTEGTAPVPRNPLLEDPFFRRFFGAPEAMPRERPTQGLGSGVIVDAKQGYILTNAHVIEAADSITVSLAGGRQLEAEVVGTDPETDVAVIKVDPERAKLSEIRLGESDQLRVGDFVVAIGNPFGLGPTATSGIVSALGRSGLGIEGYEDFIQTDASINPGNSGGALVNLKGELVGINTAILSPAGGNIGIGFAIPVDMARAVAEQLIEHGEVRRGQLGVVIQDLTPALAEALGLKAREGVVVAQVQPQSPAAQAGLQAGDVIVSVNGESVRSAAALRNRIGLAQVGEQIRLGVVRGDQELQLQATLEPAQASADQPAAGRDRLAGARLAPVEIMEAGQTVQRVGVVAVEPGSPAARAGLMEGDVVLSVNRRPVTTVQELEQALAQSGGSALLHIRRGEAAFFLPLQK